MKTKVYISLEEDSEQLVVNGTLHLFHQLVYTFRENFVPPLSHLDALQQETARWQTGGLCNPVQDTTQQESQTT